jgi:adenylate cyclase, class 2
MKNMNKNVEIEVRFLEVDKPHLSEILLTLGAIDQGEDFFNEIVFYDKDLKWRDINKFVRLRKTSKGIKLAYKHQHTLSADGVHEIEFEVSDFEKAKDFLEEFNLIAFRQQEKKVHNFLFGEVTVGFDTWPGLPTYVELEGPSEQHLKDTAKQLGLDWSKAIYENAKTVIEKYYNIPVSTYRIYTFDKME